MKKILSLGLAAVLTAGLATSCKDDVLSGVEDVVNSGSYADDGIRMYFKAGIALPSAGTRSQTEGDTEDATPGGQTNSDVDPEYDYEYGYDYENNIKSVLLVFTNKDREFVTYSHVTGITKNPNMQGTENATRPFDVEVLGEIKHSDLVKAYPEEGDDTASGEGSLFTGDNPIVYVYAFCNPTARMVERFAKLAEGESDEEDKWYNWEGLVKEDASAAGYTPLTQNSIWAEDTFLMASAEECEVKFPSKLSDWDKYADKSTPFYVGLNEQDNTTGGEKVLKPILVERVAARLDFKDGSQVKYKWEKRPNTYPIFVDSNGNNKIDEPNESGEGGDLNIISVQLNRMCLVNMAKNYYYLRHVSSDGTNQVAPPSFTGLLGVEYNKNYVVDYDWKDKLSVIPVEKEDEYFNFPLYTQGYVDEDDVEGETKYNRFGWYTDRIQEDFLDNSPKDDTWEANGGNSGYKIWRYVTENTLPGVESQQTVQSTGIVFKGRIVVGKDIENENAKKYMSENVIKAIQTINAEEGGKKTFAPNATKYDDLTSEQKEQVPYLYSFLNILYAGEQETILKANEDGSNGSLNQAVNHVLNNWVLVDKGNGKYTYEYDGDNSKKTAIQNSIKPENLPNDGSEVLTVDEFSVAKWARINAKLIDPTNNEGPQKIPVTFVKKVPTEEGSSDVKIEYVTKEVTCDCDIQQNDFRDKAASGQITVYRPYNESERDVNNNEIGDGWGYYCYYFYWNRHNDNGQSGKMGNMEFATVRNNVYKLYVESIGALGHPRHRIFDPDPVDPKDPDEDPLNYIQVKVQVLPWVVRENKITF